MLRFSQSTNFSFENKSEKHIKLFISDSHVVLLKQRYLIYHVYKLKSSTILKKNMGLNFASIIVFLVAVFIFLQQLCIFKQFYTGILSFIYPESPKDKTKKHRRAEN